MSSTDKINIVLLSDDEVATCALLLSQSFGHTAPFVDIYFPSHDTPSGQVSLSKRLTAWKQSTPESAFLKAFIKSIPGGEDIIAGFGVWTLMKEPPPAELAKVENVKQIWPEKDDREFMTRLWSKYVIPRTQAIKKSAGKGVYVLELLAVCPDYQRMGAGTGLVEWGTRAADEKQLKAVVEGTPVARRCYEKCGLQVEIEEMDFDVGDEFIERRKPVLNFLKREPKA